MDKIVSREHKWEVEKLVELQNQDLLYANPEYQRGITWTVFQRQRLLDSVLRGYPLPKFYLHRVGYRDEQLNLYNERLEIVDGQQRLHAIAEYLRGRFALLDPSEENTRFPLFLRKTKTPWAGKRFSDLDDSLQDRVNGFGLTVVEIEEASKDQVRDLFVRLQSGTDLKPQERRDAYPGEFCRFIFNVGGKDRLVGGHPFFNDPGVKSIEPDTPKSREFAAQLAMTIINLEQRGTFSDVNSKDLDHFYYENVGFAHEGPMAQLVECFFGEMQILLAGQGRPPFAKHEVYHLAALWLHLREGYAPDWKDRIADVAMDFSQNAAEASESAKLNNPNDFWLRYGSRAQGSGTNTARSFARRHEFYLEWMRDRLKPTELDPKRSFRRIEREIMWFRLGGVCAYAKEDFCPSGTRMRFDEAQVHHVLPYSRGGSTCVENAVLTHDSCNARIGDRHMPVMLPHREIMQGVSTQDCVCKPNEEYVP